MLSVAFCILYMTMMKKHLFLVAFALFVLVGVPKGAYAQKITRGQAFADIDEFYETLKEVHYNPFLYVSAAVYDGKVDSIKRTIGDSIDVRSLILKLSTLTAALNDGHTMPSVVQSLFKADFRRKIFFPLGLVASGDGRLIAAGSFAGVPAGAVILRVNDVDITGLYGQAKGWIGGLEPWRVQMGASLMGNYLYYSGVVAPFHVTYLSGGRMNSLVIDSGVTFKESLATAFPQIAGTDYSFKVVDNKVGYIDLISMGNDYKRYGDFFDSCFTVMRAAGVRTLAIDLRRNTGGNSVIADLLISYFNTKPYALSGGRYRRVSQRYKDYLLRHGDSVNKYLKEPNGTIMDQRNCGPRAPVFVGNTLLFDGKVYLITGTGTFSSAMQLADAVKQYHMATIIGAPTGESTNDFGEVYKFDLRNSGIQMQVTTTFDLGADCDSTHCRPVMPDYLVSGSAVLLPGGDDPVMRFILGNLK